MSNQFWDWDVLVFSKKGKIGILGGKPFRPRKKTTNRLNPKIALLPGP